jgi:ACR3 family arsenite transporter
MKIMSPETTQEKSPLSLFEKLLVVWIAICMGIGILLSQTVPGIGETINSWQVGGISIPIGICLFLMMYPALLNLQLSEIKKVIRYPKSVVVTLISNWILAPLLAYGLARLFLGADEQLFVAFILLGSSPCTAMVLVWGKLAHGNQEQNFITTSLNTITIMFLYAPVVSLLTGFGEISIDRRVLFLSVLVFIGIPLVLGIISKRILVKQKGQSWFDGTYRPIVGKISIYALLTTLIILFSLNGQVILENPDKLLLISIPLLIHFVIIVSLNIFITKGLRMGYREAIITVIIGSSSHFEIAIATAVGIYGVGSIAALGTTMGLFWEVPVMLSLVYFGRFLGRKGFWGKVDISQSII